MQSYTANEGERTTGSSARRWSSTGRTRRTTPSLRMPTATSRTSMGTSSRGGMCRFDWTKPVDGSDSRATEWQGLLSVDETPHLLNPARAAGYSTRTTAPWAGAGPKAACARREDYPALRRERGGDRRAGCTRSGSFREGTGFTLDSLICGGLRQLPAVVREALASAGQGLGQASCGLPNEGGTGRAGRRASPMGPQVGHRLRGDIVGGLLGQGGRHSV
jgi:hypothetical protein